MSLIFDIKFKIDLSNYRAKSDLKNTKGTDTSKLATKSVLASLIAEIGKIYKGKSKIVPIDLSKLSIVVKNEVVKKDCVW